ncbi:hypothetical protein HYDPIDRAFT_44300 [Hydnomerulius pinastri MD-312]|uniref:Uncharacterized protein n=1 Tax=Hydnomerulius pinastri MD-312 TaxID=994086 RepID=A0A0C9W7K3_9AGAM|nr:hypothetical protein HYDPIDRAFT_44300 [Hydnomerulius pinastri MD-312]
MSYFDRRTSSRDDRPSRSTSHQPSGHERLGLSPPFAPLQPPAQPNHGQQQQQGSLHQAPMGRGGGGHIPPPPGHTRGSPVFHCPRCRHQFRSQAELDQHSLVCAAAALVTGMFSPYSYPHQPHSHAPRAPPLNPNAHHQNAGQQSPGQPQGQAQGSSFGALFGGTSNSAPHAHTGQAGRGQGGHGTSSHQQHQHAPSDRSGTAQHRKHHR